MEAAEKAAMTLPVAVPRLSSGMASPMMAKTKAPITPPKAPARIRASKSIW
jgi:hypothetical protein